MDTHAAEMRPRTSSLVGLMLLAACERTQPPAEPVPFVSRHALPASVLRARKRVELGTSFAGARRRRPGPPPLGRADRPGAGRGRSRATSPHASKPHRRARRTTPDAPVRAAGSPTCARSSSQPIQERTVAAGEGRVQITRFADNHTAARLLLPELWSKVAATSGGQLYAAAPARDIVVWTTSAAKDDQVALRGQARTAYQSRSYPISPAILRWTARGWTLEDANPTELRSQGRARCNWRGRASRS